jgi:hypothetical protein
MTTAGDLINSAMEDAGLLGLGQTLSGQNATKGLVRLNRMIAQWRRKRWLIWHLIDVALTSTGAQSYTIGIGGNFNTNRPDRLEGGCFIRLNPAGGIPTDYELKIIPSREDYAKITLKSLSSFGYSVFYDAAFPLGNIFVWPVPQASIYEIHLLMKDQLVDFAALATVVNMPEEYELAIQLNLAMYLRVAFRLPADDQLNALAAGALNTIRNTNAQIPTLRVPAVLRGSGRYNILSDQSS